MQAPCCARVCALAFLLFALLSRVAAQPAAALSTDVRRYPAIFVTNPAPVLPRTNRVVRGPRPTNSPPVAQRVAIRTNDWRGFPLLSLEARSRTNLTVIVRTNYPAAAEDGARRFQRAPGSSTISVLRQTNLPPPILRPGNSIRGVSAIPGLGPLARTPERLERTTNGAVGRFGPHKVHLPLNLNQRGAIQMRTPEGRHLRSHVLGLSYFDTASGRSVLIAELKDSRGRLVPPNAQVIYRDAFAGLKADVLYTYTRFSFAQDVILRERPPSPAEWGLNPATTRLEVLTEFVAPPTREKTRALSNSATPS